VFVTSSGTLSTKLEMKPAKKVVVFSCLLVFYSP